uniref:Uncharacterized protein n=1 Tax=Aegilops tauschii subsp. strangulata TaxID=200361 RepID=A0A453DT03_AEGTS
EMKSGHAPQFDKKIEAPPMKDGRPHDATANRRLTRGSEVKHALAHVARAHTHDSGRPDGAPSSRLTLNSTARAAARTHLSLAAARQPNPSAPVS